MHGYSTALHGAQFKSAAPHGTVLTVVIGRTEYFDSMHELRIDRTRSGWKASTRFFRFGITHFPRRVFRFSICGGSELFEQNTRILWIGSVQESLLIQLFPGLFDPIVQKPNTLSRVHSNEPLPFCQSLTHSHSFLKLLLLWLLSVESVAFPIYF